MLINQILKDHLDWNTNAAQARFIPVPKPTMSGIIDKLTEEEISEVAINVAKNTVDIGLLLRGEYTLTSFLNILETWSRISCFAYKHEANNEVHNFLIQHDMERNYSLFVEEVFRYRLEEMFKIKLEFTITDNTIIFRFKEN